LLIHSIFNAATSVAQSLNGSAENAEKILIAQRRNTARSWRDNAVLLMPALHLF
jgi:hypothetical protein